jgi:uncharacterized protein involved in outer membrane biogenesis
MKRFFIAVTILLVLAAAAAAVVMRPPQMLIDAVLVPRLKTASGLDWSLAGRTTIDFFPAPKVRLEGVTIADPEGAPTRMLMEAAAIEIGLAWAPLWQRKVQVTSVDIEAPAIEVTNVQRFAGARARSVPANPASTSMAIALPELVRARGGKLIGGGAQRRSLVDNINATLSRKNETGPLTLTAAFRYAQQDGTATATLSVPDDLLAGKSSNATLSLKFADATLDLQGVTTTGQQSPHFVGRATGATASLRELIAMWTGTAMPPGTGFGATKVVGDLTADKTALSLANATFDLDQTKANGELKIDLNGGDRCAFECAGRPRPNPLGYINSRVDPVGRDFAGQSGTRAAEIDLQFAVCLGLVQIKRRICER